MKNIEPQDTEFSQMYSGLLKNVGEQIRTIRKSQCVNQPELAACIEADKAFISNIENGNTNVTLKTLARIAYSLELEITISLIPFHP